MAATRAAVAGFADPSETRSRSASNSPIAQSSQSYNLWLQDWELWAMGGLIDELVVQNYAHSVKGFARDLDQPALRKAREWRIPTQIGILAGFGPRTTAIPVLREKVQLARERGHGVVFFYWEAYGACMSHSGIVNVATVYSKNWVSSNNNEPVRNKPSQVTSTPLRAIRRIC